MPTKKPQKDEQLVKKETLYLVSLLALAVGFFGGVMFGVYKSETPLPGRPASSGPSPAVQAPKPDLSNMIAVLEEEVASNPGNVTAWIELANNYFDTDQYEKAILAYQRSLEIQPNNANVLTDMGVMYRRSGKPQEAIKAFDKAMQVDPKHEVSRFNKGVVLLHDLKDVQGAIQAWEDLMSINPVAMTPGGQSVDQMVTQMKEQLKQ